MKSNNNKKVLNYSNLINNIEREKEEIANEKDYLKIDKVISEKYTKNKNLNNSSLNKENYIRQGISVTREEVAIIKETYAKLSSIKEIVNKSQIYRAGLQLIKGLSAEKIVEIIKNLNNNKPQ